MILCTVQYMLQQDVCLSVCLSQSRIVEIIRVDSGQQVVTVVNNTRDEHVKTDTTYCEIPKQQIID